jgi:ankyrin repeat protein
MKNIRGYIEHIRESEQKYVFPTDASALTHMLIKAVDSADLDECKSLINAGADVNKPNRDGFLPLQLAAFNGNTDIVNLLVDAGARVNMHPEYAIKSESPLHYAAFEGHIDVVKLLIDAGAFIDAKNKLGRTPLNLAAFREHQNAAKLLILAGADIKSHFKTFKEFSDFFGGDIKWVPLDLIPSDWHESAKFTGTFGGFY